MYRAYVAILIALSLVAIQTPLARGQQQQQQQAQPQPVNSPAPKPAPPDKHIEKIKRTVQKIGIGSKITVFLNNGDELHGAVSMIDTDSFQVAEIDLHQVFTLQYKYVKKIRSGYGGINLITGKRTSPRKGVRLGVTLGALFAALGLPLIILAVTLNDKDF